LYSKERIDIKFGDENKAKETVENFIKPQKIDNQIFQSVF